ncbi:hypothetical protein SERLADRAFT_397119, partial [Serpula lacrymans var. lacrymans S7.9]
MEFCALFFTVLRATPYLLSISVRTNCRSVIIPPHSNALPSQVIPLLASYEGPPNLAGLFINGRPVTSVKLRPLIDTRTGVVYSSIPTAETTSSLSQLSSSSAPLQDLRIYGLTPGIEPFYAIRASLPELKCLDVALGYCDFQTGDDNILVSPESELDESSVPVPDCLTLENIV